MNAFGFQRTSLCTSITFIAVPPPTAVVAIAARIIPQMTPIPMSSTFEHYAKVSSHLSCGIEKCVKDALLEKCVKKAKLQGPSFAIPNTNYYNNNSKTIKIT
eukprot:3235390-Amphidinium_carterae.1